MGALIYSILLNIHSVFFVVLQAFNFWVDLFRNRNALGTYD